MALITKPTNNDSGRRSFRLSPLEMLILGLILVVVFYLISLWITGAFEAPKQAAPTAAPAQLLDRALSATERVQARLLTIEKKLAALDDRLNKATSGPDNKKVIVSPKWSSRLDALEKKVADLSKSAGASKTQPAPKVDLTPLEARIVFLEKKVGEKPGEQSLDQRLAQIDQRLEKMSKAPAEPAAAPQELSDIDDRLSKLEERTTRVAENQQKPGISPAELKTLDERLGKLEERTAQITEDQEKPGVSPAELKTLDQRLGKLEERTTQIAKNQEKPFAALSDQQKLNARLDELDKRLKQVTTVSNPAALASSSRALSQLEGRLAALENKAAAADGGEASIPQDIDDRLRELEGAVKKMEPSEAHTSASVASLDTRLQNLERATPKAGAAAGVAAASLALMETRLHKIEATLTQASESLRKVRAPVTDPELIQRLDRLEKAGGAAKTQGDKKLAQRARKIDQRLAAIDKRLAELSKAQSLTSRHLAVVMDKTKQTPARTSPQKATTEKKPERRVQKPQPKTRRVIHTVRRGQTLYGIARRYGVKASDIRRWNPKLQTRKNLWINEDLIIYTTR